MNRENRKPVDWRELATTLAPRTAGLHRRAATGPPPPARPSTASTRRPASASRRSPPATPPTSTLAVASARARLRGGPLVAARAGRAQEGAAALRGTDPQAPRGARADRNAGHGQADHGLAEDRRARPPRTASPGTREAIDKVYDEVAPTSHDSLALITREPVGRRRRDRAVEFPAADGDLEARSGARDRQLGRAEALGEIAADRASRSPSSRSRPACRRAC